MLKLGKDLIGTVIAVCAIFIFAKFMMRLDTAEKEGTGFKPLHEATKLVREAGDEIKSGWADTTSINR